MESIVGTKTSVQAHWRKNARKLLTIFLTNFHLANEMVFSSMFRKISVSKQSISLAFMFLRMLRSCFITNIRYFFCFFAENIGIMRKMRISVNYADPHRRFLSDAMFRALANDVNGTESQPNVLYLIV